jgi:curved DNA-binding protein
MTPKFAREVLGVSATATPAEVRRAFRNAVKRAHPDAGGDEGAFRQLTEAYRRLQGDLAEDLAAVRSGPRPPPRGERSLEISPRVALEGGDVDHRLADGRLIRITLPAGLRQGDKVRAAGVALSVYVRAQDGMLVRGDDLWITVKAPAALLRKGGRVSLDTPLGRRSVWIDRKAAERGLVRLDGQGLPARGGHPRGHLFVRLTARPGATDSAALTLLRRFAAAWAA